MTPAHVIRAVREALEITLIIGGPVLLAALVVGVVIGFFSAITQIQDQSLPLAVKVFVVVVLVGFLSPWMIQTLVEYMVRTLEAVPTLAH